MNASLINGAVAGTEEVERLNDGAPLWVPLALGAAPLAALGLGRFAYGLLLPAMRADLHWSYTAAGAMNTANAAGYLVGAFVAPWLAARCGERRIFPAGLFVTAIALAASGASGDFAMLLALRTAAGLFGAPAFVTGASLAATAGNGAPRDRQALLISIYFAGGGFGIVLSSVVVHAVLAGGVAYWRWGWIGFGAISFSAAALAVPAVLYRSRAEAASPIDDVKAGSSTLSLWPVSAAYTLFGVGYISYITFIVAFLGSEAFSSATLSAFWIVLGLASIATTFFWGRIFAALRGGVPLALVLIVMAGGALAPLATKNTTGAFLSAALFGASIMAAPAAVTAFIRRARRQQEWTGAFARLTFLFGLGQSSGPLFAGYLSDSTLGIQSALAASVVVLAAGAAVALWQKDPVAWRE
jgi:predicted MFS family arabinose efflux permease